jgi:tight adherence protein B
MTTANPMLPLLILLASLVGGAIAVGTAIFFWMRYKSPEPSLLQDRLRRLKGQGASDAEKLASETLLRTNRFYKDSDYKNEKLGRQLEQFAFFRQFKLLMLQSGMKQPPDAYFMNRLALPAVLMLVLGLVTGFMPLLLLPMLLVAGTIISVRMQRQKRYNRFIAQLPDALTMLTSSLRAGHSFQSALVLISSEMSEPIGVEFSMMVRDINLGIPVREALLRLVSKMDSLPDVCMFATAVTIQREAGGNLAEVLENLSRTIRERFKLKGQISALTGQSRLTGYVLGAAPITLLAGLSLIMYNYVKPLYETDIGHLCLLGAAILQGIGFMVIRKIIDIRV